MHHAFVEKLSKLSTAFGQWKFSRKKKTKPVKATIKERMPFD